VETAEEAATAPPSTLRGADGREEAGAGDAPVGRLGEPCGVVPEAGSTRSIEATSTTSTKGERISG